jgi:plasmid segregation protein ParM
MIIGLDVGYWATKVVSHDRQAVFPSVVGTPDKARFSLNSDHSIILTHPDHVQVGQGAVKQSRFVKRREDRSWIESDEWYNLMLAALTEITTGSTELRVVTGLPVAFFSDRDTLHNRLLGLHKVQREDRRAQSLTITNVNVILQPFGALLSATLDGRGAIVDQQLAIGAVGVIDIGGKTTNLLSVNSLTEINRETASAGVGAWDAVRALRTWLADNNCPHLDLRDHQIVDAVIARQVKYYGQVVDLTTVLDDILKPLADQVLAEASQLWNEAAGLDAILISGGGALLLGPYIKRHFRHARVVENPVFANATGFWKFAERLARS